MVRPRLLEETDKYHSWAPAPKRANSIKRWLLAPPTRERPGSGLSLPTPD